MIIITIIVIILIILICTIVFARFEWAQRASYIFFGLGFTLTAYSIYRTYMKDSDLLKEQQRQSRDNYHTSILREFMNNQELKNMYTDIYGDVNVDEHAMYQLMIQSMENVLDEYDYSNIDQYWINTWKKWFDNSKFKLYLNSLNDEFKPQVIDFLNKVIFQ